MKAGEFICGHCGVHVKLSPTRQTRNECTECHWSKHVKFGITGKPPCGAMMRPHLIGNGDVTHHCEGCGFVMTSSVSESLYHDLLQPGAKSFRISRSFSLAGATDERDCILLEDHLDVPGRARSAYRPQMGTAVESIISPALDAWRKGSGPSRTPFQPV